MKVRNIITNGFMIALLIVTILSSGCSVVGLGVGAVIDACIIAIAISFSESMNNLGSCSLY